MTTLDLVDEFSKEGIRQSGKIRLTPEQLAPYPLAGSLLAADRLVFVDYQTHGADRIMVVAHGRTRLGNALQETIDQPWRHATEEWTYSSWEFEGVTLEQIMSKLIERRYEAVSRLLSKLEGELQSIEVPEDRELVFVALEGDFFREDSPVRKSDEPHVYMVYIDVTWKPVLVAKEIELVPA